MLAGPRPDDAPRRALLLILLLFAAIASGMSALIPLGEAADEVSHQSYVRYVAEYGGVPPVVSDTTVFGEAFQPPLYYALAAPLTAWLPRASTNLGFANPVENNPDWELRNPRRARVLLQPAPARWPWRGEALAWHLARLLSVALGMLTVVATARLAALVFPGERWVPVLAAALAAFLPSFLGLSAAVTNDSLLTALATLLLWLLARLVTGQSTRRGWMVAGLLGGLLVWTKASGWLFVGTVMLAAFAAGKGQRAEEDRGREGQEERSKGRNGFLRAPLQLRSPIASLFRSGATWLLLAAPLWALNLQRGGDVLGRGVQARVTEGRAGLSLAELGGLVQGLYRTWWAGFGGAVHLHFPAWVEGLLLVPVALVGIGLLRRYGRRGEAAEATRWLVPLLVAHVALVGVAWLGWSRLVLGTGQGRLLFPALPALAVLGAGGLLALASHRERAIALGGSVGALTLAGAALLALLLPTYRAAPPNPAPPPGASAEHVGVSSQPLALVAHALPWTVDSRIAPGEETDFYVAWQSSGPLPDLRLRLRWVKNDTGAGVGSKESAPLAGHPLTDEWQPGRYAVWHRLRLPADIPPGFYRLMLALYDPASGEPLPLLDSQGNSIGTEVMVGATTVVEP